MNKNKRKYNIKVPNTALSLLLIPYYLFLFTSATAQTATSSPYSRYGIGDVNNKGFAQPFAMGGTSIALQNDTIPMFFINNANPASYSNVRLTTADLGINYTRMQLESSTTKQTINSASLGYLTLAVPLKKWWGASIGLIPYSSVGYKVTNHEENVANIGTIDYLYEGSGGINQLYLGNGIKPLYGLPRMFLKSEKYKWLKSKTKKDNTAKTEEEYRADQNKIYTTLKRRKAMQPLSLGFNASYLFGNIDHTKRTIFPANNGAYNTRTGTTIRISDVYLDYGVQYAYTFDSLKGRDLKENTKLLLGATFAAQSNVSAKIDSLSYNYYTIQGYEQVRDTVVNSKNFKGNVTFPLSFGIGVGFKKGERWLVAADFAMQNWSSYSAFNQTGGLKNSMRVSVGAQWVPNPKASSKKYLSRVHYRFGGRYAQTALELKSTQLSETAVSIGLGFPVGRNYLLWNFSMINIGFELGQRGTATNGLIKENFMRATIGFTINDKWFVKPKFD